MIFSLNFNNITLQYIKVKLKSYWLGFFSVLCSFQLVSSFQFESNTILYEIPEFSISLSLNPPILGLTKSKSAVVGLRKFRAFSMIYLIDELRGAWVDFDLQQNLGPDTHCTSTVG